MQPIRPERRQRGADDEPPETKDLTKKKLHERLSIDWFLPPNEARGVTRIYLVQVFRARSTECRCSRCSTSWPTCTRTT